MASIILGSSSPWRQKLLKEAGYTFEVMVADIDEDSIRSKDYEELPLILARAKSEKLLKQIKDEVLLITCDQVVVCKGELREKPRSQHELYRFIDDYSAGYPAQTNTAVVVVNTKTGNKAEGVDKARIFFKQIPHNVIGALLKEGSIMNTSGGFMSEHPLFQPYVKQIEGSKSSIIGLPIELTERLIDKLSL